MFLHRHQTFFCKFHKVSTSVLLFLKSIFSVQLFDIKYYGSLRGEMVKVRDCEIVVSEFELHLCYGIHFQINTLGRG